MTKRDSKRTYHKPKPRLAIYGGAALTAYESLESGSGSGVPANVLSAPGGLGTRLERLGANLKQVAGGRATRALFPVAGGIAASVIADKLGVNKVLAKARLPFRV